MKTYTLPDTDPEIKRLRLMWASYFALRKLERTAATKILKQEYNNKAKQALQEYFNRIEQVIDDL